MYLIQTGESPVCRKPYFTDRIGLAQVFVGQLGLELAKLGLVFGCMSLVDMIRKYVCVCVCGCVFSEVDLKKVTEILTRMFFEPQSKVLSVFVETIVDLVSVHADDLSHWLHVLLPRLFLKLASDLRGSIHSKVQLALQAVRWLDA